MGQILHDPQVERETKGKSPGSMPSAPGIAQSVRGLTEKLVSDTSFRLWAGGALLAFAGAAMARPALADVDRAESRILERTNQFRQEQGLPKVTRNEKLQAAAESFARFMATTGKYGHDADGATAGKRARAAGYAWCDISENIAYQFDSRGFETQVLADKVLDGWKKSPDHRANLLDRASVETGIAIARSEKTGYYYSVQVFAQQCRK